MSPVRGNLTAVTPLPQLDLQEAAEKWKVPDDEEGPLLAELTVTIMVEPAE